MKFITYQKTVVCRLLSLGCGVLLIICFPQIGLTVCSAPAGTEGEVRYDSSAHELYFCDNINWIQVGPTEGVPPGFVVALSADACPAGYITGDGSAISRTTYADLFAAIGVIYGSGDGSSTFNLPDYRGLFLRGVANGSANDPDRSTRTDRGDGTTGDAVGTKQLSGNMSHSHNAGSVAGTTDSAGDHAHSSSGLGGTTSSAGGHSHNPGTLAGISSSDDSHSHAVGTLAVSISAGGDHTHTFGINNPANGKVTGSSVRVNTVGSDSVGATGSAGDHTHTVSLTGSFDAGGSHSHSVSISSGSTDSSGGHSHSSTLSGSSATSSTHLHSVQMNSGSSQATGGNEARPTNISVLYCIKF